MILLSITAIVIVLVGLSVGAVALRVRAVREGPSITPSRLIQTLEKRRWFARLMKSRPDPSASTGVALAIAVGIVVVGVTAFGAILILVRTNVGFARVDHWVGHFAANHSTSASTSVLRVLSQLGGALVLSVASVVVAVVESRRRKFVPVALFLILVVAGQLLIVNVIKTLVNRARPNIDPLTSFSGASFPSGHATAAAASLAAFALLLGARRSTRVKAALAGLAAGLAAGVACTRAFLGVHWLTDVLAGLALGWAWFAVCSIAFGGRLLRFGAPVIQAEQLAPVVAPSETDPAHTVNNPAT